MEDKLQNQESLVITFDDFSRREIFDALDLKKEGNCLVDSEGFTQTNDQFEVISPGEFGGVLRGSKVMIKKEPSEVSRYFASLI